MYTIDTSNSCDAMEVCELQAQYQLQVGIERFDPWIFTIADEDPWIKTFCTLLKSILCSKLTNFHCIVTTQ